MTPTVLAPHDTGPATTTIYQELGNDPTPVTAGSEIVSSALSTYEQFDDVLVPVAGTSRRELIEGVERIVGAEGPVLGTRPHSAYVRASGGQRVGRLIATELNKQSRKQFDKDASWKNLREPIQLANGERQEGVLSASSGSSPDSRQSPCRRRNRHSQDSSPVRGCGLDTDHS